MPKKLSVKKSKPAKVKRRPLVRATGQFCFWVNQGPVLANLKDLESALLAMTDKQFKYHAAGRKNDFAAWVQYILFDPVCAAALRRAQTRPAAAAAVTRALKKYA